ncbi:MAG: SET domain-containing protein-lysine N-methyltransferase [Ferruginibacter sp.]
MSTESTSSSKKQQLLNQLCHRTSIRLGTSSVHGIGVFANRDIKKGQSGLFSNDSSDWIHLTHEEIASLPPSSRSLIENFCLYDEAGYFVPEYGFELIDPVIYINHAEIPNIQSVYDGADFVALRDIAEGEELFVDYGELVDE